MKIRILSLCGLIFCTTPSFSAEFDAKIEIKSKAPKLSEAAKSGLKKSKNAYQKVLIPIHVPSPVPVPQKPIETCPGWNQASSSDPHSTSHGNPAAGCGYCLGNTRAVNTKCVDCPAGTFIGTGAQSNTCVSCDWNKQHIESEVYPNGTTGNRCVECPPGQVASTDRKSCRNPNLPVGSGTDPSPLNH